MKLAITSICSIYILFVSENGLWHFVSFFKFQFRHFFSENWWSALLCSSILAAIEKNKNSVVSCLQRNKERRGMVSRYYFNYFLSSEIYQLGLGLGTRQIPARVRTRFRTAEEWVMQALGLICWVQWDWKLKVCWMGHELWGTRITAQSIFFLI